MDDMHGDKAVENISKPLVEYNVFLKSIDKNDFKQMKIVSLSDGHP